MSNAHTILQQKHYDLQYWTQNSEAMEEAGTCQDTQ